MTRDPAHRPKERLPSLAGFFPKLRLREGSLFPSLSLSRLFPLLPSLLPSCPPRRSERNSLILSVCAKIRRGSGNRWIGSGNTRTSSTSKENTVFSGREGLELSHQPAYPSALSFSLEIRSSRF